MFSFPRRRVFSIGIILIGLIFVLHGVDNRSVAQETIPEEGGLTAVMQAFLKDQEPPQALNALAATPCVGGFAGPYPCDKVDLLAFMPLGDIGGGSGNDIWGWTGCSNREFALMGRSSGTSFVEITDPENPIYLGNLPTQTSNSSWRDIKTYADHAFIVSEASGHGMQVFDLTQLCNVPSPPITFSNTAHYSGFGSAHNIVINEDTGFAYAVGTGTCSGGLDMVDISTPTSPTNAGCFSADGYTHDAQCIIYNGPDATYVGQEICFNYNEDTLTIVDVTNKNNPVQISRTGYSGSAYTHQGWITDDHTYVLQDDELDEQSFGHNTRTRVWDVSDLDNPSIIGTHDSNNPAIDHNQYIKGDYAYQSNYRAGLRILNVSDVANGNLSEEAYFDIYPANNNASFSGSWSNYPYFGSGVVIVSGIGEGLFIVQPRLTADFTLTASPNALAICIPNDAVYDVSVGSFNGFSANVALSTSGEPVGTTASFSNNNMTAPYTSTLTIGNTGAATPGDYDIDIVGMSLTSTQTTTVQFSLAAGAPNATTLISPPDTATNISATPIFSWTAVSDATSYLLEVSTDMALTTIVYSATISPPDTTHTSTPLDFNTTYYWRVTANNGCGQTESAIFSFSTIDTSGMCAGGTYAVTTYETDLEDGAPGWTHSGTGDSWVLSDARTTSGTNAWYAQDPTTLTDQRLVSPPIYVPTPGEASAPILQFQNYQAFETPNSDGRCWDAGILEITTDGGANWSQVPNPSLLTDPYDNMIWNDTPGNNPITNDYGATDAWCNPGQDFLNSIVDISAYAGQTVQFRWRLGSDSAAGNEGWYLDDIKVTACTTTAPEIAVEPTVVNSTQAANTILSQTLTISNTGLADLTWDIDEDNVPDFNPPPSIAEPNTFVESAEHLTPIMEAFVQDKEPVQNLNPLGLTECVGGFAGPYPCSDVNLMAFMPLGTIGGGNGNDIWGWTGCSGREFALMGRSSGTSFVEITNPTSPIYLGNLPTHTSSSSWRDIKTYADHAFIVSEASGHGMQVFDLSQLCNVTTPPVTFAETAHYSGFGNAHNLVINEDTGYAYGVGTSSCSGGLHMVNIMNPTSPINAGCFSADGYTHDAQCIVYNGPDVTYAGQEICFAYNEDTVTIVDVTNKAAPVQISRTGYSGSGYTHQGWITADHTYLVQDDELDELSFGHNTRTRVWDVSDLDNPGIIGTYDASIPAIDHNQYVKGNYAYQSNYRAGLRIVDISDIANGNLSETAYFDIYPANDNASFSGSWSNYPYFASGMVVISGIGEGLFIVDPLLPEPDPCSNPEDIPWITVSPTSGTTTANSSDDVSVMFDSTGMIPGVYTSTLCINSNDALNPLVTVPLVMTLEPTYGVIAGPASSGKGLPGTTVTHTILVTNAGDITDTFTISASGTWATTFDPPTISLGVGEAGDVTVWVDVPDTAVFGNLDTAVITATSQADSNATDATTATTIAGAPNFVELYSPDPDKAGSMGTVITYSVWITNTGNLTDTYDLTATGIWTATTDLSQITLAPDVSTMFHIMVTIPATATVDMSDTTSVMASGNSSASITLTTTAQQSGYTIYLPFVSRDE